MRLIVTLGSVGCIAWSLELRLQDNLRTWRDRDWKSEDWGLDYEEAEWDGEAILLRFCRRLYRAAAPTAPATIAA